MRIYDIRFPGYMERCSGFTIPANGIFYALYFEENLARFDIPAGTAEEITDGEFELLDDLSEFKLDGVRHPFIGYDCAHSIHSRRDLGDLSLENSRVTLAKPDGSSRYWQFENFSGDWEQVTFDVSRSAFLFGAPYCFDFKVCELDGRRLIRILPIQSGLRRDLYSGSIGIGGPRLGAGGSPVRI